MVYCTGTYGDKGGKKGMVELTGRQRENNSNYLCLLEFIIERLVKVTPNLYGRASAATFMVTHLPTESTRDEGENAPSGQHWTEP